MAVGIPVALISTVVAGIIWGKIIGNKIYTKLPANVEEIADIDKNLPSFGIVFTIILIPLILILFSTISGYLPIPESASVSSSVFRRTVCGIDDRNSDSNVHAGNKNGI